MNHAALAAGGMLSGLAVSANGRMGSGPGLGCLNRELPHWVVSRMSALDLRLGSRQVPEISS